MSIELEADEQVLLEDIKTKLAQVRKAYEGFPPKETNVPELFQEIGDKAHQLHIALRERDHEPKHHAYMIKNRDMLSDDPEFYMHIHPIEDLLAFIKDPHANDDPEDLTIGHEFTFTVYSRRWGHDDLYRLTRTETGWDVQMTTHSGPCDKTGRPFLYSNFTNDSVFYPAELEGYLEWLWLRAADQGLTHEHIQEALDKLAKWVKATTDSAPSGGVWEGY